MEGEDFASRFSQYYASQRSPGRAMQVTALMPLTSGWAGDVYALRVEGRGATDPICEDLIVKLYADSEIGREKAYREWVALTHLHAVNYPVPAAQLVEQDSGVLGVPFLVMEQFQGQLLWTVWEQADLPGRQRLTRLFTHLLVALHVLDPAMLAPAPAQPDPFRYIDWELAALRQSSWESGYPSLLRVVDWLAHRRETVPCQREVILHRDYHPWNMLVDRQEQAVVVDWDWQIGDFRFDLAWTLTLMQRSGFPQFSTAVREEYARQSGRALDSLVYFEVLTSLRWLLNVLKGLQPGENLRGAARVCGIFGETGGEYRCLDSGTDRRGGAGSSSGITKVV